MSGNLKRAGSHLCNDEQEEDVANKDFSNEQIMSQVNPVKIASPRSQSDRSEEEFMVLSQPDPVKKKKKRKGIGLLIGAKVARVKKKNQPNVLGK